MADEPRPTPQAWAARGYVPAVDLATALAERDRLADVIGRTFVALEWAGDVRELARTLGDSLPLGPSLGLLTALEAIGEARRILAASEVTPAGPPVPKTWGEEMNAATEAYCLAPPGDAWPG